MIIKDIIRADLEGESPDDVINRITNHLENNKGVLLRKNNTVIFGYKLTEDTVGMHLFTVDSPIKVVRSIEYFVNEALNRNIKTVYGLTDNKQMYRVFRLLGINVKESDLPQYNWKWKIKD